MSNNINYQICNRCVMDTTDMDIYFDEYGNCNHCNNVVKAANIINTKPKENLDEVVKRIKKKGKGNKYDCIVGVSGGIDSGYTAYQCKKLGLRPLLVHTDNGWDTKPAINNIKKLVVSLGLDYESYVLDWEEFREIQLAFLKSSIVDIELPTDVAILGSLNKIAVKYNVKYIISGCNTSSEGILPLTWGYHVIRDMKLYKNIVKKFSSQKKIERIPTASLLTEFYIKFIKNIRTIYLLDYIPYDTTLAKQTLVENFKWEDYGGKHHESRITAFWQSYVMPTKFNMDYRRASFSSQICAGYCTREYALQELKKPAFDRKTVEELKSYVAKKYQITVEELEQYLNQPPKTYKDFPNSKVQVEYIMKMYHFIFPNKRL